MQFWLELFCIIASIALVVQVVLLTLLFVQLRRTTDNMNRLVGDLHQRVGPILTRAQILLDDTQPRISGMVNDASHIVYLARGQAQKLDRVFTDAADRLRGQLVHADRILTGTLETLEDAGSKFKSNVWGPMRKASALLEGIKVGIDLLRTRKSGRSRGDDSRESQEEELFI